MNVAELAKDLGVPASTVIAQCQRFGIDASWAGADLTPSDVVVLRAELAMEDGLLDLTDPPASVGDRGPSAAEPEGRDAEAPAATTTTPPPAPSVSSPSAVGSMPDLAAELQASVAAAAEPVGFRIGESGAIGGPEVSTPTLGGSGPRRVTATVSLDRGVKAGALALLAAVVALVAAEVVANRWAVPPLWLVATVFFLIALVDGNRARRHTTMHPDRVRGRALALAVLVVAAVGLVGMSTLTWVVVRSEAASAAPLGVGDFESVQRARWGYRRLVLVAGNSWNAPAKEVGTCWRNDADRDARNDRRVELGNERVWCKESHVGEVLAVMTIDADADAPFPGTRGLTAIGERRCADAMADVGPRPDVLLVVEQPTRAAWVDGDHDLACVAASGVREGSLLDEATDTTDPTGTPVTTGTPVPTEPEG